ncbi:hypothetical protein [Haloferula sp. BvORR071]|uniref:hypothetical protein n=1 Tax=Haloferula sp. BvORR071 TaxID=1396141 RepID=UPI0005577EC2|nr:hypothetical protein [Haloferula sp. BvORR071]
MRASKPEYPEEYLTENPYEFRESEPPWFTVFSFFSVPGLTWGSVKFVQAEGLRPFFSGHSLNSFGALVFGITFVAGAASLLGLILADIARKRREPWKGLRAVAWILNGITAFYVFGHFTLWLTLG